MEFQMLRGPCLPLPCACLHLPLPSHLFRGFCRLASTQEARRPGSITSAATLLPRFAVLRTFSHTSLSKALGRGRGHSQLIREGSEGPKTAECVGGEPGPGLPVVEREKQILPLASALTSLSYLC